MAPSVLLERENELAEMGGLLTAAAAGQGAVLVVEGRPGIGKTALLAACRTLARERGLRVLSAQGGELEQELPLAIVRQLFEPAVRAGEPGLFGGAAALAAGVFGLAAPPDSTAGSVLHGLYWLCANLSEQTPLLLAVDDTHWADEASLRFVSHLARRIADLPIVLVLCGRTRRPGSGLSSALTGLRPEVLELRPLSDDAVGRLVRDRLSAAADDEFCHACARASGGNPFLLSEALSSLVAEGVEPVAAEAGRVEHLRQETISYAVLTRLARLGPEAVHLARALAVLGTGTELRQVAALAELDPRRAADLCDALAAESIITNARPLEFVHPLVRTAVYTDGSEPARASWHRRAARLLHDEGAAPELLVPHLLAAEPSADPDVVATLRAAAANALARGAPEAAATCLRRALAEPVPAAQRVDVYADLGHALGMANRPGEAAEALRSAHDLTDDAVRRGEIAVSLGGFMVQTGRAAAAVETFELAGQAIKDAELDVGSELPDRLSAAFAMASFAAMEPPSSWIGRLDELVATITACSGNTRLSDADRAVLAALAFGACATGDRHADVVAALAARAADGPLPARDERLLVNFSSSALAITGRLPEALAILDRGVAGATARGDIAEFRYLSVLRSHTALYAGRPRDAEADARAALALHETSSYEIPLAAAVLVDSLIDQGDLAEAQTVLTAHDLEGPQPVSMLIGHFVLLARGRLRLRQNRTREALDDLTACGNALVGGGYTNPAFARWRSEAALAYLALDDRAEAHRLCTEDLTLTRRFGAPFAIGIALHVRGLIDGGSAGLAGLVEAVDILAATSSETDYASALTSYGAALRRTGRRTDAQHHLRLALDLATRCGARAIAAHAADELIATGARPRRTAVTGPDSLTASELRVAKLAAGGARNREIAQQLFVTRRTVEVHLTNVYRKLAIDSRRLLASALNPTD